MMKRPRQLHRRTTHKRTVQSRRAALSPRCKIWFEQDSKVVLSDWRIELLERIEETGSLAKAARRLNVPYRTAWYKLKEMEERLGIKLLCTQSGGTEGGGSQLTTEGRQIVRRFRCATEGLSRLVERRFQDEFADWVSVLK
jgi:molybdate transport system regulatory protein